MSIFSRGSLASRGHNLEAHEVRAVHDFAPPAAPIACVGPSVREGDPTLVAQLSGYGSFRPPEDESPPAVPEPPFDPKPPVDLTLPVKRKAPRRSQERPPWVVVMGEAFPTVRSVHDALRAVRVRLGENTDLPRKDYLFVLACINALDPDPDAVFGEGGFAAVRVVRDRGLGNLCLAGVRPGGGMVLLSCKSLSSRRHCLVTDREAQGTVRAFGKEVNA